MTTVDLAEELDELRSLVTVAWMALTDPGVPAEMRVRQAALLLTGETQISREARLAYEALGGHRVETTLVRPCVPSQAGEPGWSGTRGGSEDSDAAERHTGTDGGEAA